MFSVFEIVKKNRETYYNFSTGERSPVFLSYVTKVLFSLFLACLFSKISTDFLNSIVTVYAVLIGFSFNVLFYLLSINKAKIDGEYASLEVEIKVEKVNRITDELFYNVSYFNIASILVIVATLVFFLFNARVTGFIEEVRKIRISQTYLERVNPYLMYGRDLILYVYRGSFYFLLLESLDVFLRIIARVNYYFRQRMNLPKGLS